MKQQLSALVCAGGVCLRLSVRRSPPATAFQSGASPAVVAQAAMVGRTSVGVLLYCRALEEDRAWIKLD